MGKLSSYITGTLFLHQNFLPIYTVQGFEITVDT